MKKIMPYLTILTIVLCISNLVYLYRVDSKISDVKSSISDVKSSLSTLTKFSNNGYQRGAEMRNSPYCLQDIMDKIDDAANDIEQKILYY